MIKQFTYLMFTLSFLLLSCKEEKTSKEPESNKQTSTTTSTGSKLRITNGDWSPYCSQSLSDGGIATALTTAALKKEGIGTSYQNFNRTRALELTRQGEFDGTVGWYKSSNREAEFYYSNPLARVDTVLFHLKDLRFDWKAVTDLERFTIGATCSYFYGDDFKTAEKSGYLHVKRNNDDLESLRQLLAGRIQLFACAREVGSSLLKKHFSKEEQKKVTFHPLTLHSDQIHFLLNRKNPAHEKLMQRFNAGLRKLRGTGEFNSIYERHSQLPTFKLGTGNGPPDTDVSLPAGGLLIEYLDQVFSLAGYHLSTSFYPWKRCEDLAIKGNIDAIFPYVVTEERKKNFHFSDPVATISASFYYNKDKLKKIPEIKSLADLKKLNKYRVASIRGYYMTETLQKAGVNCQLVNQDQAIEMLYNGRMDIVPIVDAEALFHIKRLHPNETEKFGKIPGPWWTGAVCVMVPHTSPDAEKILSKINKALEIAKARKLLEEILVNHGYPAKRDK